MKRTAIIYQRKAIKRVGRPKTNRTAVVRYELVEHMGAKFMVDRHPDVEKQIEKAVGRRMYICFGRPNGFPVTTKEIQELLPERIAYLKLFRTTIDVEKQTLKTWEEQNALLGDVKIYR
jgi:hypothetical protein